VAYFDDTIADNQLNKMKVNLKEFSDAVNCPVRNVLDRIGDKWSVLIIMLLGSEDTMRFNTIQKTIGEISQKMLTVTLRVLEADGIVSRRIYAEVPPRVEYQLTELGKGLLPHITNLSKWASINKQQILAHRKGYAGNSN
jgi:DNA-binding HxlR family transcriptional regulator